MKPYEKGLKAIVKLHADFEEKLKKPKRVESKIKAGQKTLESIINSIVNLTVVYGEIHSKIDALLSDPKSWEKEKKAVKAAPKKRGRPAKKK